MKSVRGVKDDPIGQPPTNVVGSESKKKKKKKVIEYNQFTNEFEFVHLSGLKGLEKACQIQQKSTNKMFDYVEMDLRGVDRIDAYEAYCEDLLDINQKEILSMKYYSRVFVEESLGDPFCKYFLIFEYCESSVETEIQHLKKRKKQIKKSTVRKIFESIAIALNHFHTNQVVHGDLRTSKVLKNEEQHYKLMPPKIKPRKSTERYFHSPEYHLSKNSRYAFEKPKFDPIKAEIFTFGMLMLEIGTFQENLFETYGKFQMNKDIISDALSRFSSLYGYHLTAVVKKMLNIEATLRPTANDIIELLQSQDLHEMEKEINHSYHKPNKQASTMTSESDEEAKENMSQPLIQSESTSQTAIAADTNAGMKKSSFFPLMSQQGGSASIQIPAIKIIVKSPSHLDLQDNDLTTTNSVKKTPMDTDRNYFPGNGTGTMNSHRSKGQTPTLVKNSSTASFSSEARNAMNSSNLQKKSKAHQKGKEEIKVEDEEDNDDLIREEKIFSTMPQEYQDEIDSKVNLNLKGIERDYQVDYLPHGHRYQGEKQQNLPHGWGIFWWANGEIYEGEFTSGKYQGIGVYYWPTGMKHYGEFKAGEIQGLGVRFYQEGDIYFGEWSKGKNHGKGTFYWHVSQAKFKGNFLNDKIYGKGTLVLPIFEDADSFGQAAAGGKPMSSSSARKRKQSANEDDEQSEDKEFNKERIKETRVYEGLWKDEEDKGIYVEEIEFSATKEDDSVVKFTLDSQPKQQKIKWKM